MGHDISVVIPTYNIEKYLNQTIDSIINQSIGFSNIELIIVDDGSTDLTKKIINEYSEKYENIIPIYLDDNSGFPGKARNIGIENSSGKYLMIIDHDDYCPDNACELLYNTIKNEDLDIVVGRYKVFNNDNNQSNFLKGLKKVKFIHENLNFFSLPPVAWTKIFRTNFIKKNQIRFPEDSLAEDLVFSSHAFLKANGIKFIEDIIYFYRLQDSETKSTSRIRNYKYTASFIDGYEKTWELFKEENKEEYFINFLNIHLTWWVRNLILSDLTDNEKKELLIKSKRLFKLLSANNIKPNIKAYSSLFELISEEKYENGIIIGEISYLYEKCTINNERIRNQIKKRNKELKTIKSSNSWKITKPIRKLRKLLYSLK